MKTRKAVWVALLTLSLLFSQLFGVVHGISHIPSGGHIASHAGNGAPEGGDLPDEKLFCHQCLAIAQLGSAVGTAPFAFSPATIGEAVPLASTAGTFFPRPLRSFLSRAPPLAL